MALGADGSIWAWGQNLYGELGIGSADDNSTPVQVTGPSNFTDVTIGYYHSVYALDADGSVWAWGYNYYGQLGTGNDNHSDVPVKVTGLAHVTDVFTTPYSTNSVYAFDADSNVWSWGYNRSGQLGNGHTTNSSVPAQIVTVTNTGNQPSGVLMVGLSGTDAQRFKTSTISVASVGVGGQGMFTVAPVTGLPVGKYSAKLSLTGQHGSSQPVPLTFEVKASPTDPPTNPPTDPPTAPSTVSPTGPATVPQTSPSGRPSPPSTSASSTSPSGDCSGNAGTRRPGGGSTIASTPTTPTAPVVTALRAPTKKIFVRARRNLKLSVIADAAPGQTGAVRLTWKVSKPKKVKGRVGGGQFGEAGTGAVTVIPGKAFKVKIQGVKAGKATLTLTAPNGVKITVKVRVVKKRLAVKSLNIKAKGLKKKKTGKYALKLKVGKKTNLKVKPVPAKQTKAIANFKATGAVSVGAAGRVTALKKGKAKITVKLGKRKKTIRVTVK